MFVFMNKNLNVVELFAGIGGFRFGLEKGDNEFFRQYGEISS